MAEEAQILKALEEALREESAKNTSSPKNETKKEDKEALDRLVSLSKQYFEQSKVLMTAAFNEGYRLAVEYGEVYGPKAKELAKIYTELAIKYGKQYAEHLWTYAKIYSKVGAQEGLKYSELAYEKLIELKEVAQEKYKKYMDERNKDASVKKEL